MSELKNILERKESEIGFAINHIRKTFDLDDEDLLSVIHAPNAEIAIKWIAGCENYNDFERARIFRLNEICYKWKHGIDNSIRISDDARYFRRVNGQNLFEALCNDDLVEWQILQIAALIQGWKKPKNFIVAGRNISLARPHGRGDEPELLKRSHE